jgi:uncharacterized membrane protein YphA (DoxX/SURF4 family)
MQAETQAILLFIGRLLLGGLFVVGGIRHLFDLPAIDLTPNLVRTEA